MRRSLVSILLLIAGCSAAAEVREVMIEPGPDVQHRLQLALIDATPGDVIRLAAGRYEFEGTLSLDVADVTLRGAGPEQTVLSFRHQRPGTGGEGLLVTADRFTLEDLAIEDPPADGVKVNEADSVTLRRVRVTWTDGPKTTNGAYGLYPVLCHDVLVEHCEVRGSSDAGIYVGQSENVVVRHNRVEQNVGGIEIENCVNADVYENVVTNNTGGILVFTLPEMPRKEGRNIRVFKNQITSNNHANFATTGNIVALVPPGSGLIVLASDAVEVFENTFDGNETMNLAISGFGVTDRAYHDPKYDPFSESVYVHDNEFRGGGDKPAGVLGVALAGALGGRLPDILFDNSTDAAKYVDGRLPDALQLRLHDNGQASFATIDTAKLDLLSLMAGGGKHVTRDPKPYDGQRPGLPAVAFSEKNTPLPAFHPDNPPEKLSAYGLFKGNGSTQEPVEGVVPYDVNSELFADYALKFRFIKLPPGTQATYKPDGVFKTPIGTILIKTFAFADDLRQPDGPRRLIETRLLIHQANGWTGLSYVWNDEQTEATLAKAGATVDVSWIHTDGERRTDDYLVPNVNQCKGCHRTGARTHPLGIKARHLNKDFAYPEGVENQLAHWKRVGMLLDAPDPSAAPRAAVWHDPSTGTLDERARAWLEINCAHCHHAESPAQNTGLDLMASNRDPTSLGILKPPVAAGRGSGGLAYDIVPGKPDESILLYRLHSTDPGVMMPELGKRLVPEEAVELVRQWIAEMQ